MNKKIIIASLCLAMLPVVSIADDGPPLSYTCETASQLGFVTRIRAGIVDDKLSAIVLTNGSGRETGWLVNRYGLNDPIGVAMFHQETLAFASRSCVAIECQNGWVSKVSFVDQTGNCQ